MYHSLAQYTIGTRRMGSSLKDIFEKQCPRLTSQNTCLQAVSLRPNNYEWSWSTTITKKILTLPAHLNKTICDFADLYQVAAHFYSDSEPENRVFRYLDEQDTYEDIPIFKRDWNDTYIPVFLGLGQIGKEQVYSFTCYKLG